MVETKKRQAGCLSKDTEIWRQDEGDFYSPSIHITPRGKIGINIGGVVKIATIEVWFNSLLSDAVKELKEIRKWKQ